MNETNTIETKTNWFVFQRLFKMMPSKDLTESED